VLIDDVLWLDLVLFRWIYKGSRDMLAERGLESTMTGSGMDKSFWLTELRTEQQRDLGNTYKEVGSEESLAQPAVQDLKSSALNGNLIHVHP
jgi:hypothetical protein